MSNILFDTHKNSVVPHGRHIYQTESDTDMSKICEYPSSQHALPQRKFVLHCCTNFPHIDLPGQESDRHHSKTSLTINFHVYHLIARCAVHGRLPIDKRKIYCLCVV